MMLTCRCYSKVLHVISIQLGQLAVNPAAKETQLFAMGRDLEFVKMA